MKIEDIVGKNLVSVTVAEDDTFRFELDDGDLLFIEAGMLADDGGNELTGDDLNDKGIKSIEYEDEELIITFLDDTAVYASTTNVKDRFGLKVELEDPEAGADDSDIDENDQD